MFMYELYKSGLCHAARTWRIYTYTTKTKWRLVFKKDLIKRQDITLRFATAVSLSNFVPIAFFLCTVQPPNCDNSELQPSRFVLIFWRYINSIKNLSIAAKSQVKPLFYDIDEWDMPVLVQWNSVITTTLVLFLKCRYSKGCGYSRNRE